jgi:CRISPR-associated exonuclease Cas4
MSTDPLEPVMISALEHYSYCPRQCALIHVGQVWDENLYTLRGRDLHRRADEAGGEKRGNVRIERALPIWSERLGLVGRADVVEFVDSIPCPVEYKSGHQRKGRHEELQLCAQALCLEEMFDVAVPKGVLYWHGSRDRREVVFTESLRAEVARVTSTVRAMLEQRCIPSPVNDKRCERCSLKESCLPAVIAEKKRSRRAASELFTIDLERILS